MIPLSHVIEVGLLMLAAYVVGCATGYAARRALRHLLRPRDTMTASTPIPVAAPQSAARRLARVGAEEQPAIKLPATAAVRRPPELPGPRRNKPDNLRLIKGIGAKTDRHCRIWGSTISIRSPNGSPRMWPGSKAASPSKAGSDASSGSSRQRCWQRRRVPTRPRLPQASNLPRRGNAPPPRRLRSRRKGQGSLAP